MKGDRRRLSLLFISCALATLTVLGGVVGCSTEPEPVRPPVGQLRLGLILGEGGTAEDPAAYAVADRVRSFSFPADHGPHPEFRSEWWYFTLVLEDGHGSPFGVQFTLFRQALAPVSRVGAPTPENRWQTPQIYLAHLALTDVAGGVHRSEERLARGHPKLAGVISEPFQLWLEDWRLAAGADGWRLTAAGDGFSVDLLLDMDRPPILQGDQGLSRKGEKQASYYYSMPGLAVIGRVGIGTEEFQVSGSGWFDREWSTSVLAPEQIGWDWFALQLHDGRSVMLFQLRHGDGTRDPYDQGLIVTENGSTSPLAAKDFQLQPSRFWTDEDGVSWPVAWSVQVRDELWQVRAALDDQKMDTLINYWEGLVDVFDAAGSAIGRGYLELTGYTAPAIQGNGRRASDR